MPAAASDDDPLVTTPRVQRIVDLHPEAEVVCYETGGHSLLLTRTDDYIADVTTFIESSKPGIGRT